METPEQNIPVFKRKESPAPSFNDVHKIMLESSGITPGKFGNVLSLLGTYENEEKAIAAEKKLQGLGLSPERTNRNILVTYKASQEEINRAQELYNFKQ